jgi:nucleotide-binding universal stress UspA family protein
MEINQILIPTDFSPAAQHAQQWALRFAQSYGATLHLLHVVAEYDPDWFGDDHTAMPIAQIRENRYREAKEGLAQLAPDPDATGIQVQHEIRHGMDVANAILTVGDEIDADLIVTGTHGREGLAHVLLGSVAEKVVRRARCPVLTVGTEAADQPSIQRVLAPIDFSDPSKYALRLAKEVTATYSAQLDLLFVAEERTVPVFSDTGIPRLNRLKMDPEIVKDSSRALEQLSDSTDGPDVPARGHVAEGDVSKQVVRFAETHDADLIIMATRGLSGLDRFFLGSVTQRVVRSAPCPVLTVNIRKNRTPDEGAASDESVASADNAKA